MFTILYASGARVWDVPNRTKLHEKILASEQDISEIYERTTPVTNRVRKALAESATALAHATPAARRFMSRP